MTALANRTRGINAQLSMRGDDRRWEMTVARLDTPDAAFTTLKVFDPIAFLDQSAAPGSGRQVTGTVHSISADGLTAIVDVQPGAVYWHNVRNVITYSGAAESTFAAIKEGYLVYYDRTNANALLSTSPLDKNGKLNPIFGFVVLGPDEVAADFPKGGATASTQGCAVAQVGSMGFVPSTFISPAPQVISVDGAVSIPTIGDGRAVITKGTALAGTIAPPTAGTDDGKVIQISSTSAAAHVITQGTVGFNAKGSSGTATWGAQKGNSLTIMAYNGNWYVLALNGVTIA